MRFLINKLPLTFRDKYRFIWHNLLIALGKFIRIFYRPEKPKNVDGSINLHLGCGNIDHPAFINIDGFPAKHIHYVTRIDKLPQFPDESVDLIYACHCLEHFSHRHLINVLKEWRRVLKKNGVLRISVPDFDSMVELYLAAERDMQYVIGPLTGGQTNKYDYHFAIFNEAFLTKLFFEAGFVKVQRWIPGSSTMTIFDDWSGRVILVDSRSFPISLNLEAVK